MAENRRAGRWSAQRQDVGEKVSKAQRGSGDSGINIQTNHSMFSYIQVVVCEFVRLDTMPENHFVPE